FVDTSFQRGDRLAGAGFAVIEVAGDLAQGAFQSAQSFRRTRPSRLGLHAAHTLDSAGLLGLKLVHSAFETSGDGDLFTLRLSHSPRVMPERRARSLATSRALGSIPFTLHGDAAVIANRSPRI